MDINQKASELIEILSEEVGCKLEIKKIWPDSDNPGFYCRFYGLLIETKVLKIEVAGSLCHRIFQNELNEEVDLFYFINGKRVTTNEKQGQYLWKYKDLYEWDDIDEGYENKNSISEILLNTQQ